MYITIKAMSNEKREVTKVEAIDEAFLQAIHTEKII